MNSHWALIITYVTVQLPFSTFLMIGFYQSIPVSLDEAAQIDGCSRMQALFKVISPRYYRGWQPRLLLRLSIAGMSCFLH